jgi:hypothetical protein
MTLTPPFGDDAAARSRARRLLVKKSPTDAEDRSLKCRSRDGQKIAGEPDERRTKNHSVDEVTPLEKPQGCSFI